MSQLGATAQQQYSGEGLSIQPTPEGARLRADFQDLDGRATAEGLWLESMTEAGAADCLRVRAQSFGWAGTPQMLPPQGVVKAETDSALFLRPGLVEEYRVSMDGIRQDFIVLERPAGAGSLGLALEVTGAHAETADYGVKLTLHGSSRELGYSRLHVTDARGRELPARMTAADSHRISIQVDDTNATYPVRIDPTFSDADWITFGGACGTNGSVAALAVDGTGNLYIGGSNFQIVGSTEAANIAKWDGTTWTALGSGVSGGVYAMAVMGGNLYVGGSFSSAGGVSASRIARWNGSAWFALGTGVTDPPTNSPSVSSLKVVGAELYVGGHFQRAGGIVVNHIAKWDGANWSALGTGMSGSSSTARVNDFELSGGYLYAGGIFSSAGGAASSGNLARWHLAEQTWSGIGGGASAVNCLAATGDDLYIGGSFPIGGGGNESRVARWNGTQWNTIGPVLDSGISDMIIHNGQLYVCGLFIQSASVKYLARWDGAAWVPVGQGADDQVSCLASLNGDLIAGGEFQAIGGVAASRLARWNGTSWSSLTGGQGASDTVNAIAVIGADVYVGGEFGSIGGIAARYLAKWNGSQWQRLGSGLEDDFAIGEGVRTLAVNGTDLYVGGDFGSAGGMAGTVNIAKWDGSAWHALGNGLGNDVHAIAIHDGSVYAGGDFQNVDGTTSDRIAKWDGAAWTALGNGFSSTVRALASYQGELYAGGAFTQVSQGIVKWNGTAWSAVGQAQSGVGTSVSVMQVWNGQLYVAGSFTQIGGLSVSNLARWNSSAWSAVGSNLTGVGVVAFAPYGGHLLVSRITTVNGVAYDNIAAWNGGSWAPWGTKLASDFGTASHGQVRALAVFGSRLMAGGQFINAGGRVSTYLAQLQLPDPEIVLEQPAGAHLISGVSAVGYGEGFQGIGKSKIFTLRNSGPVALTVNAVSVTGGQAAEFALNTTGMLMSVPAGGSTTFTVTMSAASLGAKATTLQILSNDPDEGTIQIALNGTAVLPPEIVMERPGGGELPAHGPGSLSLGYAAPGETRELRLILRNTGTGVLAPLVAMMEGADADSFVVQSAVPGSLAAGGSHEIVIRFSPTVLGLKRAALRITSNDADEGEFIIPIHGGVPKAGDAAMEFGTAAVTTTDVGLPASPSRIRALLRVQMDATLLGVGSVGDGMTADFALFRSLPDGSPNTDFSSDGALHTPLPGIQHAHAAMDQVPDMKVVVVGETAVDLADDTDFMMMRYLPSDSAVPSALDASFGTNGVVVTAMSAGNDAAHGVVVLPGGKIMVCGEVSTGPGTSVVGVARYLANGTLDVTYDGDGMKTIPVYGAGREAALGMQRDDFGRLYLAGCAYNGTDLETLLIRLTPEGVLDTTFAGDGIATYNLSVTGDDSAEAMLLDGVNRVMLTGYRHDGVKPVAYAASVEFGQLSAYYGGETGGVLNLNVGAGTSSGTALCFQTIGTEQRLVVTGNVQVGGEQQMWLARLSQIGDPDESFGPGGIRFLNVGPGSETAAGAALTLDGTLVVGGSAVVGGMERMVLVGVRGAGMPRVVMEQPVGTRLVPGLPLGEAGGTVNFGSVGLGQTAQRVFTVRNIGTAPATGLTVYAGGPFSPFMPSLFPEPPLPPLPPNNATLEPGGELAFAIDYSPTLQPPFPGPLDSTTLTMLSNDPETPSHVIHLTGTPLSNDTSLGSLSLTGMSQPIALNPVFDAGTLTYATTVPYQVLSAGITGSTTHPNARVGLPQDPTFMPPMMPGPFAGSVNLAVGANVITVVVTAQDGVTTRTYQVTVTRLGVSQLVVEKPEGTEIADDTSHDFGTVLPGGTADLIVTIRNTGSALMEGIAANLEQIGGGAFSILSPPATTLAINQSLNFTVRFTPTDTSTQSTVLRIASNDPRHPGNGFSLNLIGNTAAPEIVVEQSGTPLVDGSAAVDYGVVAGGSMSSQTFTIRNTGNAPLTGLSLSKTGTHASDFTLGALSSTTLAQDASTTFTVIFSPGGGGIRTAALQITSNDADENPFDIALTGTAPIPGGNVADNFDDNVLNTAMWLNEDYIEPSQSKLTESSKRLNYTATVETFFEPGFPPMVFGEGQSHLALLNSQPSSTEDWEVVVDVTNSATAGASNYWEAGAILEIYDLDHPTHGNRISLELGVFNSGTDEGTQPNQFGRTFLGGLMTDGNDDPEADDNLPATGTNTTGVLRVAFNAVTKVFTLSVDRSGPANGLQWETVASYGIAGTGGSRNADWGMTHTSRFEILLVGFSMNVAVTSGQVAFDNFKLTRSGVSPPVITQQPASRTIVSGQSTPLSVGTSGFPLSYQWYAGASGDTSQPVAGARGAIFITPALTAQASYWVRVSNSLGSEDSETAVISISTSPLAPTFATQPLSQLAMLGQALTFNLTVTGSDPLTYQWRKGTTNISNAKSSILTLSPLKTSDAGLYSLRATNGVGTRDSDTAYLGIVTRGPTAAGVNIGTILTLNAVVTLPTGTSARYLWHQDGVALSNGGRRSGVDTKTLKITGAEPTDAGNYTCQITMVTPAGDVVGNNAETVVSVVEKPVFDAVVLASNFDDVRVGQGIDFTITADNTPTKFIITGLPPGVKLDAAKGRIYGIPTAVKIVKGVITPYTLKISASNTAGTSDVETVLWTVLPLFPSVIGTYNGLVAHDPVNQDLGGSLKLTVASTAALSGTLKLGALSYTLVGSLNFPGIDDTPAGQIVITRKAPLTSLLLAFEINKDTGELTGSVADDESGPAELTAWRATWSSTNKADDYVATYNTALDPAGGDGPEGYGFMPVKVTNLGAVSWTGKLADGTGITGSTGLGPDGQIAFQHFLYTNTGSIQGWLNITSDTGHLDGVVNWFKSEQPEKSTTRSYKSGFANSSVTAIGAPYLKPAAAVLDLPTPDLLNAKVTMLCQGSHDFPSGVEHLFTITNKNAVTPDTPNDYAIKLSVAATTGAFSGSITLYDEDPSDFDEPIAILKRTVSYTGILVKREDFNMGAGYFIVDELPFLEPIPDTDPPREKRVTATPQWSGSAMLQAAD